MKEWKTCKNILCIRPDNMGDLIMSGPAIRALKETFGCNITLLTSSMAANIVPFLPDIDDVIQFDVPWLKTNTLNNTDNFFEIIEVIKQRSFDAAIIFTVFSQNPLPSAMIAYLAGIPKRLAYCRENPYDLLTHWVPDKEPYSFVQHQVQRDLQLVETIGALTQEKRLHIELPKNVWPAVVQKLAAIGVNFQKPWLILHAGVSEPKREYPQNLWIETAKKIIKELGYQIILTGNTAERKKLENLQNNIGRQSFNAAGLLSLEEFITLVKRAPLVVSVNTSTIHIAAAVATPVIVLYALSNPQHLPWMATGKVLLYDIPQEQRSRNEVLQYVHANLHPLDLPMIMPETILQAIRDVLIGNGDCFIPQMVPLQKSLEQVF
ncbi:MAG: glycosyltransferase family 9 protein [Flavisolibacter sp.]